MQTNWIGPCNDILTDPRQLTSATSRGQHRSYRHKHGKQLTNRAVKL